MHELFEKVLTNRDLSKAGDLFSVDSKSIVHDLSIILQKLREISDTSGYLENLNDQSVVEICITRVTSAVRETSTIEEHSPSLIALLESCLKHDLKPTNKDEDTPHAKIASDVLSCMFLHYSKRPVMQLAIPVAVQFLQAGNKELGRNVSSYLTLAAIDSPDLLAKHMKPILESVLIGNHGLIRILPQIYKQNKDPVHDMLSDLVDLLPDCDTPAATDVTPAPTNGSEAMTSTPENSELPEKNSLLHLFGLVAKHKPSLLEPHLSKLVPHLSSTATVAMVIQLLLDVALNNAEPFIPHMAKVKATAQQHPAFICQVIQITGAVGRLSEIQAIACMEYLMSLTPDAERQTLLVILRAIKNITEKYRNVVGKHIKTLHQYSEHASNGVRALVQQIKDIHTKGVHTEKEFKSSYSQTEGGVTVITVGNPPPLTSSTTAQVTNGRPGNAHSFSKYQDARPKHDRPHSAATVSSTYSERTVSGISGITAMSNNSTSTSTQYYPQKDATQHFCEKHFDKIKVYMERVALRIPLPSKITLEGHRHKKRPKVHFLCEKKGDQCLYCQHSFNIKTKQAKTWIHLMFLDRQAKAPSALSPRDPSVAELREIWETMMHTADSGRSFVTVVTSSFPTTKDQDSLRQELDSVRFFDVFEFNGSQRCWACFLCNHPEKATGLLQDGHPIIAGHLKEKKGRWKFFKRWKTRYFTLSGSTMTYSVSKGGVTQETYLPINKIQSVKAIKKGSRDIPRAFEIFANDQKFILKPKERKCAEQWVQCIHIAVARSHKSPSSGPPIPEQFLLEQETKVSRL